MRNSSKLLAVATASLALVTCGWADSLQLNTNIYTDIVGGGELLVKSSGLDTTSYGAATLYCNGFATFSVEYGEHYSSGGIYTFTQGPAATGGDVPSGSDPLSMGTAWLYSEFAKGTLAGYNYSGVQARLGSALELQLAFWYLEDETGSIPSFQDYVADNGGAYDPTANIFVNAVIAHFGDLESAHADANGAFGVVALNLTAGESSKQTQLYLTADHTSNTLPDNGTTIGLLAFAIAGLAGLRRKFSK